MADMTGRLAVRLMIVLALGSGLADSDDGFVRREHGRVTRPAVKSARRVTLHCPLCAALGRDVAIVAELDLSAQPTIVADLSGCPHAEVFGQIGRLTLDQERQLITAALDVWEARRG
jgi:hypothetical protein